MPTYEFWYSETDTYKAWFDAKNIRNSIVSKYGSQAFRQRIAKIYTDVIES